LTINNYINNWIKFLSEKQCMKYFNTVITNIKIMVKIRTLFWTIVYYIINNCSCHEILLNRLLKGLNIISRAGLATRPSKSLIFPSEALLVFPNNVLILIFFFLTLILSSWSEFCRNTLIWASDVSDEAPWESDT